MSQEKRAIMLMDIKEKQQSTIDGTSYNDILPITVIPKLVKQW
jgi:hypothetical protein